MVLVQSFVCIKQGVLGQLSGHTERCRGLSKRTLGTTCEEGRIRLQVTLNCDTVAVKVSADPMGSWRWDAPQSCPELREGGQAFRPLYPPVIACGLPLERGHDLGEGSPLAERVAVCHQQLTVLAEGREVPESLSGYPQCTQHPRPRIMHIKPEQ